MAERRITKKRPVRSLGRKQIITPEAKRSRLNSFGDFFRLGESYTSLVLGIIVVIAVAALLVSFARTNPKAPGVSKKDISATHTQVAQNQSEAPGGTYTVKAGDDLWNIAVKVYNDGHQWTRIAELNNITDPNVVVEGMKLQLPQVEKVAQVSETPTPQVTTAVTPTIVAQATLSPTPTIADNHAPTGPPQGTISGTTYTVKHGDSLWGIAVRAYGDGYKWVDIARANNLQNPDVIHSGNVFTLPQKG
jgi:nucleoid-associated protein YgaU